MYCQQELQQPYTSSHCSGWITHGFHWSAVNNFKATCSNPLLGLYKGRGEDPAKFTEVVAKVQKWIREERVIVFGKSDCWVCSSAKDALEEAGCKKYAFIDVEREPDAEILSRIMVRDFRRPELPRVYINGRFIGGGKQIQKLRASGELKKILEHL
jgi:glutaredoxin-related protein